MGNEMIKVCFTNLLIFGLGLENRSIVLFDAEGYIPEIICRLFGWMKCAMSIAIKGHTCGRRCRSILVDKVSFLLQKVCFVTSYFSLLFTTGFSFFK